MIKRIAIIVFVLTLALTNGVFAEVESGGNQTSKAGSDLTLSKIKVPSLKDPKIRKAFRGEPNSIMKGQDVLRQGGGQRAFITDSQGKIIKEITPQRVKVLKETGKGFEGWQKLKRPLNAEELKILKMIKGD